MFRFACSPLGNEEDARDAVQDALMKIWSRRERLGDIHNPEAWCMQITKNLCLDRYKALKVRTGHIHAVKASQEAQVKTPYDQMESKDNVEKVKKIMEELPGKFKMIIHLREVEGYAYKEIAVILGLSMEEVKTGLFRARKLLKDNLIKNKVYGLS